MWSEFERHHLLDTLRAADPQAPTLCAGWQVRHLVAHLYLRRHRPWAMKELVGTADQAITPAGYAELVNRFAEPVPARSPLLFFDHTIGEAMNLAEYVIHHEDVRRGSGPVPARELPMPMAAAVLRYCTPFTWRSLARCPAGVELRTPAGSSRIVRTGPAPVRIEGTAADLALLLSGRSAAAEVQWSGPTRAQQLVRSALGLA